MASKLDWEKDKAMSYGNKPGYRYLSVDKMKRNLLPVFMAVGLDFKLSYREIEDRGTLSSLPVHWTIECDATLTDIETGYSETTSVYGESGDSLDKGLSKASTYALKTWLSDTFMLVDGIDPDADPTDGGAIKSYTLKTDKEKDEIKSKVLSNGTKPEPPQEEPKVKEESKVKESPKEPESKPEPVEQTETKPAPDNAEPPARTPAEVAIEKLKSEAVAAFKPSIPQKNMIDSILARWAKKKEGGEVTPEQDKEFNDDLNSITNSTSAVAFIKKYKGA